jgi:transglutaminase-like putative cysteine protease
MLIAVPRLAAGDTASALVTFEVRKTPIRSPAETGSWKIPARPSADLRKNYLGVSPSIETTHPEVRRLAGEIVQGKTSAWDKVRAIYDWVRANVKYQFDPELKGALTALRAGQGDCEELTSLFIALCRANGIPARSVWVPGHCYPEFYLEAPDGQGCWFPCQAAGAEEFGSIHEARPILQKGDTFSVPGESAPKRYVAETFRAKNALGDPRVEFIRKPLTE